MAYLQDIERINALYYDSSDAHKLREGLAELDSMLSGGNLIEKLEKNAEALFCRIYVKVRLYDYLRNFSKTVFNELTEYISSEYPTAEKKGYKKTCEVMDKARLVLKNISSVVTVASDADSSLTAGVSSVRCDSVIARLEDLRADVARSEYVNPFGDGVVFADVKAELLKYVDGKIASAQNRKREERASKVSHIVRKISDKYRLYEYFPLPDHTEAGRKNTSVICTPYLEEARLYATHACKDGEDLYEVDASVLEGYTDDYIPDVFQHILSLNSAILILSAEKIGEIKRKLLYVNAMCAGKKGSTVFIHDDNGDNAEYERCLKYAEEDERLNALDIDISYISMPCFADVCRELEEKKLISGAVEYDEIKEMPFMGFMGFNRIIAEAIAGGDWKKTGKKLSLANTNAAKRYLLHLRNSYLFIDSGWGDYSSLVKKREEHNGGFDYDGIRDIDLANVRKIVESEHSIFAKCGMITRYCTLGGGDKTDWDVVEREEMQERITLATKLVFRILRVEVVPEVEVLDELENKTAGGLCCGGGKKVLFKYDCCQSWQWLVGAIVHESFHALQAKLEQGGWSQWYYDEMGITRGRAELWRQTHNIYDHNTNSKLYTVHIVEADARAFEIDCDDGRNFAWNTIEFD